MYHEDVNLWLPLPRSLLTYFVPWLRSTPMLLRAPLCSAEVFGAPLACCTMAACFDAIFSVHNLRLPKPSSNFVHQKSALLYKLQSEGVSQMLQSQGQKRRKRICNYWGLFHVQTSDPMPQRAQWEASKIPSEGLLSQVPLWLVY